MDSFKGEIRAQSTHLNFAHLLSYQILDYSKYQAPDQNSFFTEKLFSLYLEFSL